MCTDSSNNKTKTKQKTCSSLKAKNPKELFETTKQRITKNAKTQKTPPRPPPPPSPARVCPGNDRCPGNSGTIQHTSNMCKRGPIVTSPPPPVLHENMGAGVRLSEDAEVVASQYLPLAWYSMPLHGPVQSALQRFAICCERAAWRQGAARPCTRPGSVLSCESDK